MVNVGGGNGSMKKPKLFQQDWDSNNGDVSIGNGLINSHSHSQYKNSINFKEIDGDVENCDVSSGYGSMNSHTVYQHNCFKPLMNYNYRDDIYMNANL